MRFMSSQPATSKKPAPILQQDQEAQILESSRPIFRISSKVVLLLALGILIWQRNFVIHAPVWYVRSHWADRSDFYLGSTNGVPNRNLVQQARNYLTDVDHVDASGNITTPEALKPLGIRLNMAWFRHHAPDRVDYNPFISDGRYVVSWLYYPGCQKTIRPALLSDTDWFNMRGTPCYPLCQVTVRMNPDLRLTSIKMDAVQS
jgi:hypothetical protein